MQIRVVRLDPDLPLPEHQHEHDAGVDLHAREGAIIAPGGGRVLVPTGISIAIPPGYGGFVLPRSGLALKHGVTVLNGPGLIDALYRGEIKVPLVNTDPIEPFTVERADRIAQLVVQKVEAVDWVEVDELDATVRDTFGFGSTGV
ncbi:MAG: dUTP diphosphatase [Acidimicrobiia bacterium]